MENTQIFDEDDAIQLTELLESIIEFGDREMQGINFHFFEALSTLVEKSPTLAKGAIDCFSVIQHLMDAAYRHHDYCLKILPTAKGMAPDFFGEPEPKKAA